MTLPSRDVRALARSFAVSAGIGAAVFVLAIGMLAATGTPIGSGVAQIVSGALGSTAAIHETLARSGILILTGLAAALAFRIRLYNFGAEGQLQAGALIAVGIAALAGAWPVWPAWAILPIELAAGAAAGGAIMLGATLLKLKRGVEEGIITLLLNFVIVFMAEAWLGGESGTGAGTAALGSSVPSGLFSALTAAIAIAVAIRLTVWGFQLRATAGNAEAARYAGMPVAQMTMRVGIISGALAGLAGVFLVADTGSTQQPGLGYAGIAVAVLARYSPIGSIAAGFFIAGLMVGTQATAHAGALAALPDIVVALTLLLSLLAGVVRDRVAGNATAAS